MCIQSFSCQCTLANKNLAENFSFLYCVLLFARFRLSCVALTAYNRNSHYTRRNDKRRCCMRIAARVNPTPLCLVHTSSRNRTRKLPRSFILASSSVLYNLRGLYACDHKSTKREFLEFQNFRIFRVDSAAERRRRNVESFLLKSIRVNISLLDPILWFFFF